MPFKVTALSLLIFFIYLCIGSVLFYFIEHDLEIANKKNVKDEYNKLGLLNCIKFDDFKVILDIAWSYPPSSFSTMDPSDNSTANNWQWDPVGAFFFSFVVLTTIGFGNQTPTAVTGQVAVIIFSVIGIPICLNAIASLSRTFMVIIFKLGSCLPPYLKKYNIVIGFVFACILFIIIFIIPAALLTLGESWSFHESLYFTFITLSTIGFGDFIAGTKQPDYCQLLLILWMLLGLVYVTTVISFIQILLDKFSIYLSERKIPIHFLMDTKVKHQPKPQLQLQQRVKRIIKTPIATDRRRRY